MKPLEKHWKIAPALPEKEARALEKFPPILRQLLYNRNISNYDQAMRYLRAEAPPDTEPNNILGMQPAVDRISYAIRHHEPIAVYGDYDADGVTATALLVQTLRELGATVAPYIPNRFEEGYGLNMEALNGLSQDGVRLVITVDCGIRSLPEAEYARQLGMDMIITDHHHPGPHLPESVAIINPKQAGDTYPEKDLAGVGLAYKLAQALSVAIRGENAPNLAHQHLDLVALGTVTDLAPLRGENRHLVRAGLKQISQPQRQGLYSLIAVSRLNAARITAGNISFSLGPRLNAAGRLESALDALNLLITTDLEEAGRLSQQLEAQNRERQEITRQIQEQAEKLAVEADPDTLLIFAAHRDFNPGVVGLAASRLTEQYYRPAIVAHQDVEYTRGSCRSIPEFHITDALDQCADLLVRHGGHAAAAGFTVHNDNLPELVDRLQKIAEEQLIDLELRPELQADLELSLSDLQPEILDYLRWMQPTGIGNRQAYFVSRGVRVNYYRAVGKEGNHLKLVVSDGRITFDAIAFRQGHWVANMPNQVDLNYVFEVNEYNGSQQLQLNVRDLKPAE